VPFHAVATTVSHPRNTGTRLVLPPRSALNTVADNGEVDARSVTEADVEARRRNEAEEWVAVVAREESRASYPAGPFGPRWPSEVLPRGRRRVPELSLTLANCARFPARQAGGSFGNRPAKRNVHTFTRSAPYRTQEVGGSSPPSSIENTLHIRGFSCDGPTGSVARPACSQVLVKCPSAVPLAAEPVDEGPIRVREALAPARGRGAPERGRAGGRRRWSPCGR
jgi:hypothetical protein